MKKKQKYYLVGNAHLDPIWQWRWQEGSAEAKATIRSALDRMKEFPEFKFVCSSASVYRWVEEFAPEMFEEIKQRVQEGRFIVVGGWHVQPDCNSPGGEGFARQTLYSQRYFKEKLGVTATVGYDVDSFGHNLMLPQILKKSGMDSYIFMRPSPKENDLPHDLFNWVSPDGSSVTTYRILDPYCFNFNSEEELQTRMDFLDEKSKTDIESIPFFYGVGNHGGGPTIRNLQVLEAYRAAHPEKELRYATLVDFFDELRASGVELPRHTDDLQHHASGCYAAVSHVKNGIRRSETALAAAESYAMLANRLFGKKVKNERFEEAWNNICFLHFHDSLGGCSIKEAHDDAVYMYGMAQNTAAVEENNALQTISWAIDTADQSHGLPVVVFNPHSFPVEQQVCINKQCSTVVDAKGNPVPSQLVHSSTVECYWRYDTLFTAKVPALGYAVYYIDGIASDLSAENDTENSLVKAIPCTSPRTSNDHTGVVLENDLLHLEFDRHSGYIVSYKKNGEEIITAPAAVPVVIDEYYHDTWSHAKNFFTDAMARFGDADVTVTENGPVRATVKVVSRYNKSTLTQYFSLALGSEQLQVKAVVDWHEEHKMLKLAWPMKVEEPKAYYEIPFGVIERPADGEEEPGQMWTAVKGTNAGYALLNDNTYSSSAKGGTIYHTVVRSPIYGDHGGPRTEESIFTDQGRREFAYCLQPVGESWAPVIQAARALNKPLTNIIETWHEGKLADTPYSGLCIDAENIVLSAIKRSEDGTGLVLRLYETDGKETPVTVFGDLLPAPLSVTFSPWSMRTYLLKDGESAWKEVLLSEFEME
ncbi:MAG: alpha-mannosidase [Clostridia bacterium]|nr:alpha-mannosidase [Clostridia bacterium]